MIHMPVARTAKRKPASGLSHHKIVAAALRLIDRDGLDEFSTRKLGRALRCEAMTIYWYYPSKDALLDAVVEKLVVPIGLAAGEEPADWVDALRRVAHAYRRIAHEHPQAFPLLAARRFASEGTYAFLEQLFAFARRHGIPDRTAARFYRVVSSYCNGFGMNELAARRDEIDPSITKLRARFEHVDAVFAWLDPKYADENFEFGLELVLEALARTVPAPGRAARSR
jgi:AcrR family transcriptional regulator